MSSTAAAAWFALVAMAPAPGDTDWVAIWQDHRGPVVRGDSMGPGGVPVLDAQRLDPSEEPRLDGVLDDEIWRRAAAATDFTQFSPDPGAPASQRTEARVLYGDDALWVAIRAWDTAADSVVGQLTRRDQSSYSDLVAVVVDSYYDRRTAFHFEVNPEGVQRDLYRFDDTGEDPGWDAVWASAVSRDDQGWSAEMRIPYSQLRFRDADSQTWGINFLRHVARHEETSVWSPTSRNESAIVSRFGDLRGLDGLSQPRRLEVMPYSVARVERAPGDEANPYFRRTDGTGTVGADVRFGVTSDLTLTLTLNPDFGQVEADPAQVNLSAYEVFLPERRPFFVEGSNFFNLGLSLGDGPDAVESLFYSRRIGRAPHGRADPQGGWSDQDDQTTILGAWKLSGKTAGGWSIGLLNAVTQEESARVTPAQGGEFETPVEPFTNYAVARIQKDFRAGRTALGVVSTSVNRGTEVANRLGIPTGAYTAGIDGRHRFADDTWEISGYLMGSHVRGSEATITSLQRNPTHFFQRPDADHLGVDSARTSLSGLTASGVISKIAGGHWRLSSGFQTRSPGFDTNDAGYLRGTDETSVFGYVGYDQSAPIGPFRRFRLNTSAWSAWSWGGEHYAVGGNVNGNAQFTNFISVYAGVNHRARGMSANVLRGGPSILSEASWNGWLGFNTDSRAALGLNLNGGWSVRPESDSWSLNVSPSVRWRPSGRLSVNLGTFWSHNLEDRQWVGRFGPADDPSWLVGRLDQHTVGLTGRMDLALSPTLSLQVYAQPFVSAGTYLDYKRVGDPHGDSYDDRFMTVDHTVEGGIVRADVDGDGTLDAFGLPDFNVRQFRSNTVLRWEYRPGSTLFVVWAQGRDGFSRDGTFDAFGDVDGLFGIHPRNTFMVKVSYWLNP